MSDNTSKIIEIIYSDLLTNYSTGLSEFNRENIVVDVLEITGEELAHKLGKASSDLVGEINAYNTLLDFNQMNIKRRTIARHRIGEVALNERINLLTVFKHFG